jgi:hypothetical protein
MVLACVLRARAEDNFQPLFNGRDLSGWINVNCAPDTWVATNGLIFCTGKPIGELRTTRMYQNFILELEWRHLKPQGNAGVFVWADALTARGQPFIRGIEVQVLDGREGPGHTSDGDIFPIHGAKMIPINGRGGDRAFPTEKRMKPSPEWNHYRIECRDGAIALAVNGKVVTRGHSASPRKGYICLESEGSPIEFRNLRVCELPAEEALAPEHIADSDEHFKALYTGVDASGWQGAPEFPQGWKANDWTLQCTGEDNAQPLVSARPFGDGVLVIDWRWNRDGGAGDWTRLVRLRGFDLSEVLRGLADGQDDLEVPAGRWNRAVFRLRGNHLQIEINGRALGERTLAGIPPSGPLTLQPPSVPAQIANLFWRRLD